MLQTSLQGREKLIFFGIPDKADKPLFLKKDYGRDPKIQASTGAFVI